MEIFADRHSASIFVLAAKLFDSNDADYSWLLAS
jgi:hypothetical protein